MSGKACNSSGSIVVRQLGVRETIKYKFRLKLIMSGVRRHCRRDQITNLKGTNTSNTFYVSKFDYVRNGQFRGVRLYISNSADEYHPKGDDTNNLAKESVSYTPPHVARDSLGTPYNP